MRKDFVKKPLEPTFEQTFRSDPSLGGGLDNAANLVLIIAQVLDAAARGEDCYLSINVTKKKDAAMVKLVLNGSSVYASGSDWVTLLAGVDSLI